jgi:hypothetical protein
MRTSFRHQSEAQPPNGPLTAATSPDTPSHMPSHAVPSPRVVIGRRQDKKLTDLRLKFPASAGSYWTFGGRGRTRTGTPVSRKQHAAHAPAY